MPKKEQAQCATYVMNMEAANFGECNCGAARDMHTASALAMEKAKPANRDSGEVRFIYLYRYV